jgi:excinuclease ABC subunit A
VTAVYNAGQSRSEDSQSHKETARLAKSAASGRRSSAARKGSAASKPAEAQAAISLRGLHLHNLKQIDLDIPLGQLVAICGLSGSGKTSLALDTLYAEGQRRYIESFSAYTRRYLQRLDKPLCRSISNLPPATAVTRQQAPRTNRSTVGTASQTYDYLRLLYAKLSQVRCYGCGEPLQAHDPQSVATILTDWPAEARALLVFGMEWEDRTDLAHQLAELQQAGFIRIVQSERTWHLAADQRSELAAELPEAGEALVVVDRLKTGSQSPRLIDSLETAFTWGQGRVGLLVEQLAGGGEPPSTKTGAAWQVDGQPFVLHWYSHAIRCHACRIDYPDPEPSLFSFNNPLGACPTCEGFGDAIALDMHKIVPNPQLTIRQNAIACWSTPAYRQPHRKLLAAAEQLEIPTDVPFAQLTADQVQRLRSGSAKHGFVGLEGFFAWLDRKKYKMHVRAFLSRWRSYVRCPTCQGRRLNPLAQAFQIGGLSLVELCQLPLGEARQFIARLALSDYQRQVAGKVLEQVEAQLRFLEQVGLGYLPLSRTIRTLSGGEAQRVSLGSALGSNLVNMLYVLDEPTVGLHPLDTDRLVAAIESLRDRGNSVVVVEHEEPLLKRADWIIEIGPAAGRDGGQVVFEGRLPDLLTGQTLTGRYLSGRLVPQRLGERPKVGEAGSVLLRGATGHNLKNIDVDFPLGCLCLVTGVSGSGKSSLVQDTLYPALTASLAGSPTSDGLPLTAIHAPPGIAQCIMIDQGPVSRSPRSNPITYIKGFDEIRKCFAQTAEAQRASMGVGDFSFNSALGRCPTCEGDGTLTVDMQFLADVSIECPDCHGSRYRHEVLQIRYRDRTIADVLAMTVDEAREFFRGQAAIQQKLKVLSDVGLGYIQLGQAATTLSAGEGQRLKLAGFLAAASQRRSLILMDEPTTGLHFHDIQQLIRCFEALLAGGHSLIVVEHNLHLIAAADHVIDLGPQAAAAGGEVVAVGSPCELADNPASLTGRFLRQAGLA